MKKVIKLTESDLTRIIRRVIEEQSNTAVVTKYPSYNGVKITKITNQEKEKFVMTSLGLVKKCASDTDRNNCFSLPGNMPIGNYDLNSQYCNPSEKCNVRIYVPDGTYNCDFINACRK
tara:strand:- start:31 stop:384 length:354 start_codon:yes stop_codon:yes gene_type:complete